MKKVVFSVVVVSLLILSATARAQVPFYMLGDSGKDVIALQKQLKTTGYYKAEVDGNYGKATVEAVKALQKNRGLAVNGVVSLATYKALLGKDYYGYSATNINDKLIINAMKYMGVKYVFGGTTKKGFDCSGFVQFVFNNCGYKLPRTADIQYAQAGQKVARPNLKPGDLVFFETYEKGASHVGIYMGDNKFIHASSSKGVTVSRLSDDYYKQRYVGAKRLTDQPPSGVIRAIGS